MEEPDRLLDSDLHSQELGNAEATRRTMRPVIEDLKQIDDIRDVLVDKVGEGRDVAATQPEAVDDARTPRWAALGRQLNVRARREHSSVGRLGFEDGSKDLA